eukprot:3791044-Pyramimonas_sp.AAC.1
MGNGRRWTGWEKEGRWTGRGGGGFCHVLPGGRCCSLTSQTDVSATPSLLHFWTASAMSARSPSATLPWGLSSPTRRAEDFTHLCSKSSTASS